MALKQFFYQIGDVLDNSRFSLNKRLSDKEKVTAGALATGLTATAVGSLVASFLLVFPPREEIAKDWASEHGLDYTDICYTPNPETETELGTFNDAARIFRSVGNQIEATGPIGRYVNADLISNDTIFCFGPRHDSGHDIHKQGLGRELYFTADDLADMDVELAAHLFERRGLYPYMDSATDQREKHYITSAALIWKRSTEAMKAVVHADAMHSLLAESGEEGDNIFNHLKWAQLEAQSSRADAAIAFREAYQASPNFYSTRLNEARKAAFFAAYHSADMQADSDVTFLRWYEGEVDEQAVTKTRTVAATCTDAEGKSYSCTETETYTDYEDPPWYVHSEDIHPATITALSDIYNDDEPFLSLDDVQGLINDPRAIQVHNDAARRVYDQAATNARYHAYGHFDGERSEFGRGINVELDTRRYNEYDFGIE